MNKQKKARHKTQIPWRLGRALSVAKATPMGTLGKALASHVQAGSSSLSFCCCDKTLTKTKVGRKRFVLPVSQLTNFS